uniref:Leishmanolysin-like peptidase n=1 Tax=Mesocestoides corti TaxID=53468 RepID=A0A5K3FHR7_MESCO
MKSNSLGYSAHCQQELETDRPFNRLIDMSQVTYFVKHEVLHILGFSPNLYAFFRDADGQPLTARQPKSGNPALGWLNSRRGIYQWSEEIIRTVYRNWTSALGVFRKKAHLVVTPNVLSLAKKYFDCPSLEGVELEDQGKLGVSLSHWKMRILGNELMTASYTNAFRLSNLTLAFLEDTGWYRPNYSLAQHLAWGSKRGCIFSTQSCYSYMLDQLSRNADIAPFCVHPEFESEGSHFACTPDRRSFGYCNLVRKEFGQNASNIHPMFVYFGNTSRIRHLGKIIPRDCFGKMDLADFCPFIQEITWTDGNGAPLRSSQCDDLHNSEVITTSTNYNLEVFGPRSICLPIATNWTLIGANSTHFGAPIRGAACYQLKCSLSEGGLILELSGGLRVLCGRGVQKTPVNISVCLREPALTVSGSFHCPKCTSFCDVRYVSLPSRFGFERSEGDRSPMEDVSYYFYNPLRSFIVPETNSLKCLVS